MKYCYYCKKPMYSSNESIWLLNKNYDIHSKCLKIAEKKLIEIMKLREK
jgi:hypothetical protein